MAACSETPSRPAPPAAPRPGADPQQPRGAVGGQDAEHVVVLGREALRATGEPVLRPRDLLGLVHGDPVNGNHANIVCRGPCLRPK